MAVTELKAGAAQTVSGSYGHHLRRLAGQGVMRRLSRRGQVYADRAVQQHYAVAAMWHFQ